MISSLPGKATQKYLFGEIFAAGQSIPALGPRGNPRNPVSERRTLSPSRSGVCKEEKKEEKFSFVRNWKLLKPGQSYHEMRYFAAQMEWQDEAKSGTKLVWETKGLQPDAIYFSKWKNYCSAWLWYAFIPRGYGETITTVNPGHSVSGTCISSELKKSERAKISQTQCIFFNTR